MGGPVPAASPWRAPSTPFWAIQALHAWPGSWLEAESWRTLPLSRPDSPFPFLFRPSRFCTSIYSDPLTAESCDALSLRRFGFQGGLHLGGYCWFWYWRLALSFFSILSAVNVFVLSFFCGSVLVHCCSVPTCAMIIGNVHACHGAAVPLVLNDTFH